MELEVTYLEEQQIIVIKTSGVADENGSMQMASTIAENMKNYRATKCLVDHSAITSVSGGSVGIYYRPQGISKTGITREIKVAEVVPPAFREHFGFLESVCRNNGFNFKMFEDEASAMQWLA